jgi:hypothetical protein
MAKIRRRGVTIIAWCMGVREVAVVEKKTVRPKGEGPTLRIE